MRAMNQRDKSGLHLKVLWTVLVSLIVTTSTAVADGPGFVELGVDGELSHPIFNGSGYSKPPGLTTVAAPTRLRVSGYTSIRTSIEGSLSFARTSQGSESLTSVELGLGVGIHFADVQTGAIGFVEPTFHASFASFGSGASYDQISLGGEVGVKSITENGLASRFSVFVMRAFESDRLLASTTIGVRTGVSFFTFKR